MPTTRIDTEDDVLEMELTSSCVKCTRNHRLSKKLATSEEDNGSKLYRRSKSEDPNLVFNSAMRPNLRKLPNRQNSVFDKEVRTPLLESENEDKQTARVYLAPKPEANDVTECGEEDGDTDGKIGKQRGCCRKTRTTYMFCVLFVVLLIFLVALVFLYLKVYKDSKGSTDCPSTNNAPDPDLPCETFDAHIDEDAVRAESLKTEYKLPWTYAANLNSSLTRVKCLDGREFQILQSGRFKIKIVLHVDTHRWIVKEHLEKQFSVRMCVTVATKPLTSECLEKIQPSKEVDVLHFNHIFPLEEGQRLFVYLSTKQALRNIIRGSKSQLNKLQIQMDNCKTE